jgi:D-alanyl-D-alanine carboxypeptidase
MRKKILPALIAMMFLAGCGSGSGGPEFTQEDLQKILASEWQVFSRDKTNFGGGLAMQIISPKGAYFISTGMGEHVDNTYRFRTASVTKTFTAAAVMLLHQRGKLNIEDKITANIPNTNTPYVPNSTDYDIPNKDEITIRMILMHRAGIFDLSNNSIVDNAASHNEPYVNQNYFGYRLAQDANHSFTFDELFGVIARDKQYAFEPPGSQYDYSDTGYCLLGLIIERVSGKSYEDFVRDELLAPNNLLNTTLPWQGSDQTLPAPFVPGYLWMNGTLIDVTLSNMTPYVANGNMITTPLDLATWAKLLFTGKAGVTIDTVEMMKAGLPSGGSSAYGLGVNFSKKTGYGHDGKHIGYMTMMYYIPEKDIAYVIFSNVWDYGNLIDSLLVQDLLMTDAVGKIFSRMGL